MTVLAMDYFRLASIYFELTLLQSPLDCIKSLFGFNEIITMNDDIICEPLKFAFRILLAEPYVKSKVQEDVC